MFYRDHVLGALIVASLIGVVTYTNNGKMVFIPTRDIIKTAKNHDIQTLEYYAPFDNYIYNPYWESS